MLKKKIWASFQRIIELFTQKIVTKLSMGLGSGIGDPGSGKTFSRFWIHGSKSQWIPDPGSRILAMIRIRNTDFLYSLPSSSQGENTR
jgi:hypothetical protein